MGKNGESEKNRHDIIDFVFDSTNLPIVNDENYMDRWGEARSEKRLKMLVHSLSGFIRLKENHPDDNSVAISDWEDDLNYIKEEIYDAVMDASPKGAVELFHGYTYSGIPVAVAAALAVQDIFEKENIFNKVKAMSPYFLDGLFSLKDLSAVDNIRGYGMMGGVDIKLKEKPGRAGFECFKACYDAGINFKATGDCLIIAPQFICEKKHIDEIIEKLRTGILNYMKK